MARRVYHYLCWRIDPFHDQGTFFRWEATRLFSNLTHHRHARTAWTFLFHDIVATKTKYLTSFLFKVLLEHLKIGLDGFHGLRSLGTIFGKQILLATRPDLQFGVSHLSSDNHLNGVLVNAILSDGTAREDRLNARNGSAELLKNRNSAERVRISRKKSSTEKVLLWKSHLFPPVSVATLFGSYHGK